jgi:hypothetical protein
VNAARAIENVTAKNKTISYPTFMKQLMQFHSCWLGHIRVFFIYIPIGLQGFASLQ